MAADVIDLVPIQDGAQIDARNHHHALVLTDDSVVIVDGDSVDTYASAYVDEALVHSIQPAVSKYSVPIVMVPGHNLGSDIYLATPDGRDGWAQMFADEGYDVHVINDPEFDFSRGFNISPFQEVPTAGAPAAQQDATQPWANQDIWRRWGFGNPEGTPYVDTRFPTDAFDIFEANYPYVGTERRTYADAIVSLLERVGPAILMAHSAGGPQAVNAALERPDLVNDIILIEPTGPPTANDFPTLAGMSLLGVYGDYIDSRNQGNRKLGTEAAAALFAANGGSGDVISLPEDHSIFGNTHLLMQDNNNDVIAGFIIDWMTEHANVGLRDEPLERSAIPIPVADGLKEMEVLPSGEILIAGEQTTTGDSVWLVDPLTKSVTPVDVTLSPRVFPWSQLAIDGQGYGVLLEQQSSGEISVRTVDASSSPSINVSSTSTSVPFNTKAVTSISGNRTLLSWQSGEGLKVMVWDNLAATPLGITASLDGYVEVMSFDDDSGLAAIRDVEGDVHVLNLDDQYSLEYQLNQIDGPVTIDGARSQIVVADSAGLVQWVALQDGSLVGAQVLEAACYGAITDLSFGPANDSLSVLTANGYTLKVTPQNGGPVGLDTVQVNSGAVGRSLVTEVTVSFDGMTNFRPEAFVIHNKENNTEVNLHVHATRTNGAMVATIQFLDGPNVVSRDGKNSLQDGNYRLQILASNVNDLQHDTVFGEETSDAFFRLYGDVDGDRDVDGLDLGSFGLAFLSTSNEDNYIPSLDSDGDGDIDGLDLGQFGQNFLKTL